MNPEYFQTQFICSLAIDEIPAHAFIITASNPMDQRLSYKENEQRNKKLERKIRESSAICLPIIGASKDLVHREQSFLTDASKEQAILWGKEFNQRAIFEIKKDLLFIIPCIQNNLEELEIGSFYERWVST